MNQSSPQGIDRHGLDAAFDADEALKSQLIVEGQLLSAQQQLDAAADRFAQAAEIEEHLSDCSKRGDCCTIMYGTTTLSERSH